MKNNLLSSFYTYAFQNTEAIAATGIDSSITFGKIIDNALSFYHSFTELNFQHKKVVLYFPNSTEALSAIFSVLTAGICYAVIDPSTPQERCKSICEIPSIVVCLCKKFLTLN